MVLQQEGVNPLAIARLAHKLRSCQVQHDYDTRRPLLLHETLRLASGITLFLIAPELGCNPLLQKNAPSNRSASYWLPLDRREQQ